MTDEEFQLLLEEAIAVTGHERYRYLCLEHPDMRERSAYARIVIDIATGSREKKAVDPKAGSAGCCGGNPYGDA